MQSLKFGKKFGIPIMGEILLLDDIPLPQHDPDDPSITSAKSEVPLAKASQAILSLFCQCNFKQMEIQQALKSFDSSGYFTTQTFRESLSEGRFLMTTDECESISKFMDCLGSGKFALRAFMEVFNNERLYAFSQKGLINTYQLLAVIFESLEE